VHGQAQPTLLDLGHLAECDPLPAAQWLERNVAASGLVGADVDLAEHASADAAVLGYAVAHPHKALGQP
jgi:hypothetical protein